jgi:glycosyltransferase involved in cell wall biosynthesis
MDTAIVEPDVSRPEESLGGRFLASLYICYLALSDPLVETQVVAYLEGLADDGHRIHLLTFETEVSDRASKGATKRRLAARGITWHALRYHKRPSLPATIYDTIRGAVRAARLVRRHQLDVIHARVHVPGAMALIARRLARCGLVFDIRGLMAEEYVDAGRWKAGGWPWRITKWVEARAIEAADACVVLTPAARDLLFGPDPAKPVAIIPCCADVERFEAGRHQREATRSAMRLDQCTVLAYCGKFGGWYLEREMVRFFAAAREEIDNLHFLVITQDDRSAIEREFMEAAVDPGAYTITTVPPERMGDVLGAADLGIAFIAPFPSKVASSPTKVGEYLAAGLPVVATAGIAATDRLLSGEGVGVLVDDTGDVAYRAGARRAAELMKDPRTPGRCLNVGREEFSLRQVGIPRYQDLYREAARTRS